MKCQTLTNNSELILANTDIFLPSNQLTGQTQRGYGGSITIKEPILYTKSILHLHASSFSVGQ